MKKQITINSEVKVVTTVEELRALDLPIAASVAAYNELATADKQVKKFTDKNYAAKRLFEVLPEAVEVELHYAAAKDAPFACGEKLGKYTLNKAEVTCKSCLAALAPAKKSSRPDGVKATLRKLFADPNAAFTGDELLEKTGAAYKVLHDDLARLKNDKYCGKLGKLVVVKVGKLYVVEDSEKFNELHAIQDCATVSPAGEAC